ncbi:MAG: phosphate starvation-inducible protein PhoH [Spirochaetes bacterium GWD1_61_31]|nr:MAG: phosphate starvation-inducible protein PhoH [Spirochaetes bacterium GWB1_60_80]OHD30483.1 MAG: phosphate starvation-inducible protein PhoH [Spirochaetes bacterium GWC1_61_12]OHD41304.1 MAG: phosphate starvation-inducible protein PhoH [Spirochaetes bacterium GWD1_61_31]OHD44437.1 MAG: phosphate starvation-inducible protein PhoH [Spirochaetes bacterium GWE1_60_18]OHD60950.1 MAG: phosphate starvation-inducible protein PhoH [Spirochaetes bacterium GWF1_60_12]
MKIFVIDTNVLIHYPEALMSFKDNEIVIPLQVLEELDRLKTEHEQRGRSAREAIRYLDTYAKKGNLHEGVKLENGSILRVSLEQPDTTPRGLDIAINDNRIILCALKLKNDGRLVFFVSKDINARVKATALGIKAVDYDKQKVDIASLYTGVLEVDGSGGQMAALVATGELPWKEPLKPNQFIIFRGRPGEVERVARYIPEEGVVRLLRDELGSVSGITPFNAYQRVALELLLDDNLKLVTLMGKAGTGKTLLALAAGMRKLFEEKVYTRMLVSRPVVSMGKDIGFMPGEKSAKMANWMQPLFDNLDYILSVHKREKVKSADQLLKDKLIEIEALSFIRGRSLPGQFIIIDEAQNLTPHEIKTIVSRAGQGTKVVLTGDPYQIDNMYLDANSNGLSFLVDRFKGQAIYGHVSLQKTERSELADLAASLL